MTEVQIRFHGRAGQGIVTAAEITAMAAAAEGKFVQAFPFFGSEKRGPPVVAFCRISDKPIITHEQVYEPDVVVVADHTIMDTVNVEGRLARNGVLVINTDKTPSELGVKTGKAFTVDGTRLAVEVLGKNITNTVVLGAMVKATGIVALESVLDAVRKQFPGEMGEKNAKLVEKAFEKTVEIEKTVEA